MPRHKPHPNLISRIANARKRAHAHGLPGDLTPKEFARTSAFFHGRCAYCQGPAQTIDHFIPLDASFGGSTADNCVPCCRKCNALKANTLPEDLKHKRFSPERIDAIREFLFTAN